MTGNARSVLVRALVVGALAGVVPVACADAPEGSAPGATRDAGPGDAAAPSKDGAVTSSGGDGGGTQPEKLVRVEGKSGTLFGSTVTSFAMTTTAGVVSSVDVVVPYASLAAAPPDHPFADDLILLMPDVVIQQTILEHLRVNWFFEGHGPVPYVQAHFDFHFFRGAVDTIDAILCRANTTLPTADKIPPGYGTPDVCADSQGYHAWPTKDLSGGTFTGSLVVGYWAGNIVFLEPMIPMATFAKKQSFELPIARPLSAGGKHTLYPGRANVKWDADASTYTIEIDTFAPIDCEPPDGRSTARRADD
jgi:hypothetical protein